MHIDGFRVDGFRDARDDAAAGSVELARCARPTMRGHSTYTVLGFVGYGVATLGTGVLASLLGLPLGDRMLVALAPPLAFLAAVWIAKRRAGYERIVFYEAVAACFVLTGGIAALTSAGIGSVLDLVAIGIGSFLVFGRLGCFHVACCHGRPTSSRFGVRYGHAHVMVGFPSVWRERAIAPVQLVEAAASFALTTFAITLSFGEPGDGAAAYVVGYALVRIALELVRGDPDRRYWRGLSEAQRMAVVTAAAAAALHPHVWTIAGAALVAAVAAIIVATHRRPAAQILRAFHVHEVASHHARMGAGTTEVTSAGLSISRHAMPDGRTDYVWSRGAGLPMEVARRLAEFLDPDAELVVGRAPNLVHIVVTCSLLGKRAAAR